MKDVRNQGGGGFVQCGHFADKGKRVFFRCGCPHFFAQKPSNFSKFMVCSQTRRDWRVNFLRLFRTSFMEDPRVFMLV